MTWAVNVAAPFLLTACLLEAVGERVVVVSSISAASSIDWANLQQVRLCGLGLSPGLGWVWPCLRIPAGLPAGRTACCSLTGERNLHPTPAGAKSALQCRFTPPEDSALTEAHSQSQPLHSSLLLCVTTLLPPPCLPLSLPPQERGFSSHNAYSLSKLAEQLFTFELADRLRAAGSPVTCNCLDPGCWAREGRTCVGRAGLGGVQPRLLLATAGQPRTRCAGGYM